MEALKQDIQEILGNLTAESTLADALNAFTEALKNHPEALGALEGRYRLSATDTGYQKGFQLSTDGYAELAAEEAVDATILGKENDLLLVLRHELNPMAAMFTGKLTVKGGMQPLMKFAQIL